ncbi:hypothetical protein FOZ62_008152, partial [Perkinsus olseni]
NTSTFVNEVIDAYGRGNGSRSCSLIVSADIKGAFDACSWRLIHKEACRVFPQPIGSVLGPYLWKLATAGILEELNDVYGYFCKAYAYADDFVVVVRGMDSKDLVDKALVSLDILESWAKSYGMDIEPTKVEFLVRNGLLDAIDYERLNRAGSASDCIRMVGILLDANLSFGRHISHQCAKAKVMVLRVKTFARLSYGLGDDAVRAAWEQFGLSIATYGSEVWGHKALNSGTYAILTRLHNAMARVLLRAAASSSTVLLGVTCGLRHPAGAALSRWCKAWLHNDFYSQKKLCKEGKRVLQQLGLASDYPAKCERYKNWEGDVVSSQLFALDSDSGGRGGSGGPDELVGPGGLVDRGGLVGHGEDGGSGPGFRSDHAERDPLSGAVDVGNGETAVDRFLRGSALPQPDDGPDLEWLANARPSSPNE